MTQPITEIPTPEDLTAWAEPYIRRDVPGAVLIEDLDDLVIVALTDHRGVTAVGLSVETTRHLIAALTQCVKRSERFLSPEAQRQRLMEQRLAAARKRVETEGFEK